MINELYTLSQALNHLGLLRSSTHPEIGSVGKSEGLLITLDQAGAPRTLRLLEKNETASLWKHSKGNFHSFPAIRVQQPLLSDAQCAAVEQQAWDGAQLEEKLALLSGLDFNDVRPDWKEIVVSDWSLSRLAPVEHCADEKLAALRQLLSVFPRSQDAPSFQHALIALLREELNTCGTEPMAACLRELLLGRWDAKGSRYTAGRMTYYDVYEMDFPNPVASEDTRRALTALLNAAGPADADGEAVISPLTGRKVSGVGSKYPNPKLPVIGLTYLYSKKNDIHCLERYGMTGTDAYQAGKEEIAAIHDAIIYLTAPEKDGRTWRPMCDSSHDKPGLLLAYLEEHPDNDACLARLLTAPPDQAEEDETETAFEALCSQVTGSMEDVLRRNPNARVTLIFLESLDPGRKQVAYQSSLTARRLCGNMRDWSEASKNLPKLALRVRGQKNNLKPACPGPDDICRLLKMNFIHAGTKKKDAAKQPAVIAAKPSEASAMSLPEIYQVYMPPDMDHAGRDEAIRCMLTLTVEKSSDFLGAIGGAMTRDGALPSTKQAREQAIVALKFSSLIAILLWLLEIRKENYMLDVPFKLGQLLKLANMLHREYCIHVRNKGDKTKPLPAQLVGSQMLFISRDQPAEGHKRLWERMLVYYDWANNTVAPNTGLAKWIVKRFDEINDKELAANLPERFSTVEQAQMLIGFSAAIPYEKKEEQQKEDKSNE